MPTEQQADEQIARTDERTDAYVDLTLRVRYAETDQMGVAYYGNHLVWFELGRTEYFRRCGHSYGEVEKKESCYFMVAEARCRYHAPARYEQLLTVRTRVKSVRARFVCFSYEILAEDGTRIATGETLHVITGRDGKPRSLPERYRAALLAPPTAGLAPTTTE